MSSKKSKNSKPPIAAKPAKTKAAAASSSKAAMSALDAAARVLKETGQPMTCRQMTEKMLDAGYWKTSGKTPAATLSSAVQREIATKGKEGRFRKVERGQFALMN